MNNYTHSKLFVAFVLVSLAVLPIQAVHAMRGEGGIVNTTYATTSDALATKGGFAHGLGHLDFKKAPLIVRPMQMTAERYYYDALDVYTWRFTMNVALQASGETVYLADTTTPTAVPGNNLVRFIEDGDFVGGGITVATYADISRSAHDNFILEDGIVEHMTVIVEYTESHMSPDIAYKAVLTHLKYNTDDSDTYKVKSLNSDFQTEEIYID